MFSVTSQGLRKYLYLLFWLVLSTNCTSNNQRKFEDAGLSAKANDSGESKLLTGEMRNHIAQSLQQIQFRGRDGKFLDPDSFKAKNPLITKVYNSISLVFELEGFPGLIFKVDAKRKVHVAKAEKTIQQQQLTHLILPKMEEIKGMLVEEKYPIEADPSLEKDLYIRCYDQFPSNPTLKEECRKIFLDMTRFIIDTKLDDVRYDNFPLFKQNENQIKMLLLDLGMMKPNEPSHPGFLSLLWMAHPDFHDDMIKVAAKQTGMHPERFMDTLDKMREGKKSNLLNIPQGKKVKTDILPCETDYWISTPIGRVTAEKKNELGRYKKAKKWIEDHPPDQVLLNIQRAKQNLPTLISNNEAVISNNEAVKTAQKLLNHMSQIIGNSKQEACRVGPAKRQFDIYGNANANASDNFLQFLYNQGLTQPELVHTISLSINKDVVNMHFLYF